MRVAYIAAEATPYSKVGGLADVAGSLPQALAAADNEVLLFTPNHHFVDLRKARPWRRSGRLCTRFRGAEHEISWFEETRTPSFRAILFESAPYFPASVVYGMPNDLERYLLFCQAALETLKHLNWPPDIIHLNDWHTGPITFGIRNYAWREDFYRNSTSFLTIHNLRYRGPDDFLDLLGPAIYYADAVGTVSKTYAREILTREFGEGLDHLLRSRDDPVLGVLNGIDYEEFNPLTDSHIECNFDREHLCDREGNKLALLEQFAISAQRSVPLAGMVTRITEQKGLDLVCDAVAPLLRQGLLQFIILGEGDEHLIESLKGVAASFPTAFSVRIAMDEGCARRVYAGSDLFLMPSRFEPCGLGQMIAMRYGAVPVVRHTGGLADTVNDIDHGGTGFVFSKPDAHDFQAALSRAINAYHDSEHWRLIQQRCMAREFSWTTSAQEYTQLYRALASQKRGHL